MERNTALKVSLVSILLGGLALGACGGEGGARMPGGSVAAAAETTGVVAETAAPETDVAASSTSQPDSPASGAGDAETVSSGAASTSTTPPTKPNPTTTVKPVAPTTTAKTIAPSTTVKPVASSTTVKPRGGVVANGVIDLNGVYHNGPVDAVVCGKTEEMRTKIWFKYENGETVVHNVKWSNDGNGYASIAFDGYGNQLPFFMEFDTSTTDPWIECYLTTFE